MREFSREETGIRFMKSTGMGMDMSSYGNGKGMGIGIWEWEGMGMELNGNGIPTHLWAVIMHAFCA